MTFEPRPISFIKIIGTHNTANEVQDGLGLWSSTSQNKNLPLFLWRYSTVFTLNVHVIHKHYNIISTIKTQHSITINDKR